MLIVICKNNAIGVLFIQEGFFGEKGWIGFKGKRLTTARMFSLIKKDDVRTYPMRPNARTCTGRNTSIQVNKER